MAGKYGASKHSIYAWKAKYGGMEVSEAEEVKHLRDENARLEKLVADLSLDKDIPQSVIRVTPELVSERQREMPGAGVSTRIASRTRF